MRFRELDRVKEGEPFVPEESREDAANPDPPDWGSGYGRARSMGL